jgi:hypothetical protein
VLGVQDMSQARARGGARRCGRRLRCGWCSPGSLTPTQRSSSPMLAGSSLCGEGRSARTSQPPIRSSATAALIQVGTVTSYAQQRERIVQPSDLRAMPAGRALALPQGRAPIGIDLFPGAPGLTDCDWPALCRKGRTQLCQQRRETVRAASEHPYCSGRSHCRDGHR